MLGLKARQRKALYRDFFKTDDGKKVLADLARRHFVFTTTHVPRDSDYSAFNEGRRTVILDIMSLVNIPIEDLEKLGRKADDDGISRTDNGGDWNP